MRLIFCECQALKTFLKKKMVKVLPWRYIGSGASEPCVKFLFIYWCRIFKVTAHGYISVSVLYGGLNLKAPFFLACTPYSLMLSFNTVRESKRSS